MRAENGSAGACRAAPAARPCPAVRRARRTAAGGGSLDGLSSSTSRPDRCTRTPVISGIGCPAATRPVAELAERGAQRRRGRQRQRGPVGRAGIRLRGHAVVQARGLRRRRTAGPRRRTARPRGSTAALVGTAPRRPRRTAPPRFRHTRRTTDPVRAVSGYACSAARSRCSAAITGALAGSGIRRPGRRACRWRRRIRARATLPRRPARPRRRRRAADLVSSAAARGLAAGATTLPRATRSRPGVRRARAVAAGGRPPAWERRRPRSGPAGAAAAGCGWLEARVGANHDPACRPDAVARPCGRRPTRRRARAGRDLQHPARPDHRRIGEHLAVAHVVPEIELDDLGIQVPVAEIALGDRPEAIAAADGHHLVEAHAHHLGGLPGPTAFASAGWSGGSDSG